MSHTAITQFAKRLLDGEQASLIVRSKKNQNTNAFTYNVQELHDKIKTLPIKKSQTHRDLAEALGVSTTTI